MREQCVRAAIRRFTRHGFQDGQNIAAAPAARERSFGTLSQSTQTRVHGLRHQRLVVPISRILVASKSTQLPLAEDSNDKPSEVAKRGVERHFFGHSQRA